jgi:hypothetical protein
MISEVKFALLFAQNTCFGSWKTSVISCNSCSIQNWHKNASEQHAMYWLLALSACLLPARLPYGLRQWPACCSRRLPASRLRLLASTKSSARSSIAAESEGKNRLTARTYQDFPADDAWAVKIYRDGGATGGPRSRHEWEDEGSRLGKGKPTDARPRRRRSVVDRDRLEDGSGVGEWATGAPVLATMLPAEGLVAGSMDNLCGGEATSLRRRAGEVRERDEVVEG